MPLVMRSFSAYRRSLRPGRRRCRWLLRANAWGALPPASRVPRCPRQIPGPFGKNQDLQCRTGLVLPSRLTGRASPGKSTSVTESAGRIRAGLARRYGPCLVLLEHHLAPESGEGMETLDLVRIGADASPHWSRVWPTPQDNPRHAGLELWMAAYGHQIVDRPASWFDSCEDEGR